MVYYFRIMLFVESLTKITDSVYVGNIKAAGNESLLKNHNISCIVEVHDAYKNSKRIEGVEYLSMEFEDRNFTDLTLFIQKSNAFINQKIKEKKIVLVHCSGGISRSVSLVLAHLIESEGLTFDEAFKKVRKVRSIVDINYGFRDQLKKLEK
jgi:dual specificity phosphatase 12